MTCLIYDRISVFTKIWFKGYFQIYITLLISAVFSFLFFYYTNAWIIKFLARNYIFHSVFFRTDLRGSHNRSNNIVYNWLPQIAQ